jgi:fructose-bisphosphate aldolase, class II
LLKKMLNRKEKFKLIERAQKEGWALGQFNISTMEALKAVFNAAKKMKSPIIVGTSENESKYIGLRQAVALVRAFEEETGVPALLNLDHGGSFDYIKEAVDAGYDMVHFDGSGMLLQENIALAKKVVNFARKHKVLIEGEVGSIMGSSEVLENIPDIKEEDLTKAQDAEKFVKETGVDSLAIAVGTFHGMTSAGENPHINIARIKEIKEKTGGKVFLVLHGGSGTPESDIKEAIVAGVVKININTELRNAYQSALRSILQGEKIQGAPYKYLPEVVASIQNIVEKKIALFSSGNKIN